MFECGINFVQLKRDSFASRVTDLFDQNDAFGRLLWQCIFDCYSFRYRNISIFDIQIFFFFFFGQTIDES